MIEPLSLSALDTPRTPREATHPLSPRSTPRSLPGTPITQRPASAGRQSAVPRLQLSSPSASRTLFPGVPLPEARPHERPRSAAADNTMRDRVVLHDHLLAHLDRVGIGQEKLVPVTEHLILTARSVEPYQDLRAVACDAGGDVAARVELLEQHGRPQDLVIMTSTPGPDGQRFAAGTFRAKDGTQTVVHYAPDIAAVCHTGELLPPLALTGHELLGHGVDERQHDLGADEADLDELHPVMKNESERRAIAVEQQLARRLNPKLTAGGRTRYAESAALFQTDQFSGVNRTDFMEKKIVNGYLAQIKRNAGERTKLDAQIAQATCSEKMLKKATARIQTLEQQADPAFHALLQTLGSHT